MYLDQSEEFKSWVSVLAGECIRRGEVPVGASVVRSGWVGLYGRPLSVPVEVGLYGRPCCSFPLRWLVRTGKIDSIQTIEKLE